MNALEFFARFPLRDQHWREVLGAPSLAAARAQIQQNVVGCDFLPPAPQVFAALDACPLSAVRVVIVGQDPYPTPGDAHGLAFSVAAERKVPRSLKNIFAEMQRDGVSTDCRERGDLSDWAQAGVLLLNRVLTTPPGQAGGHRKLGWEAITSAIIAVVSARPGPLVALLWGNAAASLAPCFAQRRDCLVLTSGHPSPLAYNRGGPNSFRGCGHFAATNAFLTGHGLAPIPWAGT